MKGLDKYLSTTPEDDFSPYCEAITEAFSDEFFAAHEEWITGDASTEVYESQYWEFKTPAEAAEFIENNWETIGGVE